MRSCFVIAMVVTLAACEEKAAPTRRAQLNRLGGTTFELVPGPNQLPFCLAYSVSRSGLTRQLTMSRSNLSYECPAGKPVGKHPYKAKLDEGPVRIYVFFTSQAVNAASVSQQLIDAPDRQALSIMNMRLPGNAALEVLDFVPEEDVAAEVGELLGAPDAGAPEPAPPTVDAGP